MKQEKKPVPLAAPPSVLRLPVTWFTAGFFTLSVVFFSTWWVQFPVILQLLRDYWQRDSKFLVPAWSSFVVTWSQNLMTMLCVTAVELASWALGAWALSWVLRVELKGLWGFLFALGLGNGILGIFTLALGLAGLLMPGVFWVLLIAALALAARTFWLRRSFGKAEVGMGGENAAAALQPLAPDPSDVHGPMLQYARWLERALLWICGLVAIGSLAGLFIAYARFLDRNVTDLFTLLSFTALAAVTVFVWWTVGRFAGDTAAVARWIVGALVAFCAVIVVGNWLPVFQPEWFYDSLVYHLAVPEQYMLQHKIYYLSHTFFSNFPFLQEMRYMLLLLLGDEVAPKLLHWADGVLVAASVYALAGVFLGRTAAWLAAAVFLSQPTMRFLHHITMVELGVTWFEILATMSLVGGMGWLRSTRTPLAKIPRGAWFILTGWFLGFAQGTKYIGLIASVLILGCMGLAALRSPLLALKKSRWWGGRAIALVTGWAALWTGVWLAKNWLFTGDPFFPLLHTIFPAINWDDSLYQQWMYDNTKYGTGHGTLVRWLTMPTMASIDISAFGTFTLNPFPLLFLPLVFLYRNPPPLLRFLAVYFGIFFVLWAVSSQQVRFLFPAMAQASVAIAFVVTRLGQGSWLVRSLLAAAAAWLLLVSAYGEFHNRYSNNAMVPCLTGHMDRPGLLRRGVSYYDTVQKANQVMDKRARLLFVGGDESFYCKRDRICSSIYDRPTLSELAARAQSPAELLRVLRRKRVTHMLVHGPRSEEYIKYGIFDWSERAKNNFLTMWNTYGRMVFVSKGVFLFELNPEPIPPRRRQPDHCV